MKKLLVIFLVLFELGAAQAAQQRSGGGGRGNRDPRESPPTVGRDDPQAGLEASEAKAAEAEKAGRLDEAAASYIRAAQAARAARQPQKAIDYAMKAYDLAERAKNPFLQASAALNAAFGLRNVNQKLKAGEWLEKGAAAAKAIEPPPRRYFMESKFYRELGLDLLRDGEAKKAIQYISQARQAEEQRLAAFKKMRRPPSPQAIPMTQHALVRTLHHLGIAYDRAGDTDEAIKSFEAGLRLIRESGFKTATSAAIYQALGELYLKQRDFPRALENLTTALTIAERNRQEGIIQVVGAEIGEIYLQSKNTPEAIRYYKKAIDSIESTRSLLENEEYRTAFFEGKRRTYTGLLLAHLQAKDLAAAFDTNERARSRAFLDILGSRVELARGPLLDEERRLRAAIAGVQARLARGNDDEEDVDEEETESDEAAFTSDLDAAQKTYDDFIARIKKDHREQASLMSVEPLTLKQVQELMEPGTTMLEYFVTTRAVLLWVVEKDRLRFASVPFDRVELVKKIAELRRSVADPAEKEAFRVAAADLYRALVAPALPFIRGKQLVIVPHDALHYIPFQALLSPAGRYLIQDYPIYYLSSASLMQFTHAKQKGAAERALILGNPALGDPAYDLRFAEREAKEIARIVPKSEVYVEADATKPRAVLLSPDFNVLHFAVHAELDENDPIGSALLLAPQSKDDGRLKVGEIFALNLQAGLVVLSACETGLGKLSNGDELIGLTRAFIYAGTPSVVTTLWKVNDRASYELMRLFYEALKTSKKAEALRQAQLETMKQFPEPFYWAAYQLTGEP
ncbi:MAG TPA: CHAT domain-containing tetratricopeptide repeat protein [Candidatus Binatia bacterium]|jgi:CHAT domain-containing protein/tetratricopeptide (TPR) repeat protein